MTSLEEQLAKIVRELLEVIKGHTSERNTEAILADANAILQTIPDKQSA